MYFSCPFDDLTLLGNYWNRLDTLTRVPQTMAAMEGRMGEQNPTASTRERNATSKQH